MIRKICLFIGASFIIAWFSLAYMVKARVITLAQSLESDNLKISYEDIEVLGFPFAWKVQIINPTINFIDHLNSRILSTDNIKCVFDFSLKRAQIILNGKIREENYFDGQKKEYLITTDDFVKGVIKFNQPLYNISLEDNFRSVLKSLQFNNKLITVSYLDSLVFSLLNLNLFVYRGNVLENENITLRLQGIYQGESNFSRFTKAGFDLDSVFSFSNEFIDIKEDGGIINKSIVINNLDLLLDDSEISLSGAIEFFKNDMPKGKFAVWLHNYEEVIDKIIPEDFVTPPILLKRIISQASSADSVVTDTGEMVGSNAARFEIVFSNEGITIGGVDLFNYQGEN